MKVELNKPIQENYLSFKVGDILIFCKEDEYDYYQVIYDLFSEHYALLCLDVAQVYEKTKSLTILIDNSNNPSKNNGFKLIEILKPNQVVLRRVADEG